MDKKKVQKLLLLEGIIESSGRCCFAALMKLKNSKKKDDIIATVDFFDTINYVFYVVSIPVLANLAFGCCF